MNNNYKFTTGFLVGIFIFAIITILRIIYIEKNNIYKQPNMEDNGKRNTLISMISYQKWKSVFGLALISFAGGIGFIFIEKYLLGATSIMFGFAIISIMKNFKEF